MWVSGWNVHHLGPLLFLIYIDGLPGIQLSGGSVVIFADDLLLHRVTTCFEDLVCVFKMTLSSYSTGCLPTKAEIESKSLFISWKRFLAVPPPPPPPILYVNGSPREHVSSYRNLGILISSDLSWSNHIKLS